MNQVSFLQLSSGADLSKAEAVRFIRDLARKSKSAALAQLASRMSSAMKLGNAAGEDPFEKIKGLINDMIATLESEAEEDATQKDPPLMVFVRWDQALATASRQKNQTWLHRW